MAFEGSAAHADLPSNEPETLAPSAEEAAQEPPFAQLPPYQLPQENPFVPPYLRRAQAAQPQPQSENAKPNPFTPLTLPKQSQPQRRSRMSTLPPIPGQRYAYTPETERVDSPLGTNWQSAEPDYQQAYWEHLQSVAPQQEPPPQPEEKLVEDEEPELYDETMPCDEFGAPENDEAWAFEPPEAQATPHGDLPAAFSPVPAMPYADSRVRAGIPAPYELYQRQSPPPPKPKEPPRHLSPPAAFSQRAIGASRCAWRRFRAFVAPGGRGGVQPLRVATLAVLTGLGIFALCSLGRIVSEYNQSQQANRAWRESYYQGAQTSANLAAMPQGGATFAPTAVPTLAPAKTAEPPAGYAEPTAQIRATATPAPATMQRTCRTSYESNPSLVVSDRFLQLRRENQDIVGWLQLGGLEAPVMQRDNTYYQTHDRTGAYSALGAPYLHSAVVLKRPPENLLVFGNSGGGAVFDELLRYQSGGADYVRQNAFFTLDTVYESSQYVVFAVFQADTNPASSLYFSTTSYLTFPTDKAFQSYVAAAANRSLYRVAVDVAPTDGLCTLCTTGLSGGTSRLIVLARRLRSGESTTQAPQITLSE